MRFGCELSSDQSQKGKLETSLMVQWLRLLAPSAGAGFHPWSGNWIPHAAIKDPACHNEDPAKPNKLFFSFFVFFKRETSFCPFPWNPPGSLLETLRSCSLFLDFGFKTKKRERREITQPGNKTNSSLERLVFCDDLVPPGSQRRLHKRGAIHRYFWNEVSPSAPSHPRLRQRPTSSVSALTPDQSALSACLSLNRPNPAPATPLPRTVHGSKLLPSRSWLRPLILTVQRFCPDLTAVHTCFATRFGEEVRIVQTASPPPGREALDPPDRGHTEGRPPADSV